MSEQFPFAKSSSIATTTESKMAKKLSATCASLCQIPLVTHYMAVGSFTGESTPEAPTLSLLLPNPTLLRPSKRKITKPTQSIPLAKSTENKPCHN